MLSTLPLQLGDGLVLRLGKPTDAEGLVALSSSAHGEDAGEDARKLISGDYHTGPAEWTVVEDSTTKQVVSAICLTPQTWSYGGIPFGVARPELVTTYPAYRRRGLVRHQFAILDDLSAASGQHMIAVTGIPGFYRQFGYEMALNYEGGRTVPVDPLDNFQTNQPYRLRPALGAEDCAYIRRAYEQAKGGELFAGVRLEREWNCILRDCLEGTTEDFSHWAIIEADGQPMGFVKHRRASPERVTVNQLELSPEICPLEAVRFLLPGLAEYAQHLAGQGETGTVREVEFTLGHRHFLYGALDQRRAIVEPEHAWSIRIPDIVAFLRHIRPALERNLEGTVAQNFSGLLSISLYHFGIQISFTKGRIEEITKIDPWPAAEVNINAQFPDTTFLQLVCGRHRMAELHNINPDCGGDHVSCTLLDLLFPDFSGTIWYM